MTNKNIKKALELAMSCGTIDGAHHKMWVIDQMVRILTNCQIESQFLGNGWNLKKVEGFLVG